MKIQVLYIEECPNWQEAGVLTKRAFETIGIDDVPIEYTPIRTEADAGAAPFAGSPTILIDGRDLFPSNGHTRALACRVYSTEHGLAGTPTQAQIEGAIRVRISRRVRGETVLATTGRLMERMDAVGDIANANTLLHAKAARSVITSLNATAEDIDAFHLPLGVESDRERLDAIPLREAIRSPELLKTAGKEVGAKGAVVAVGVVAVRTRGKILSRL